jgi:hypothetical protein
MEASVPGKTRILEVFTALFRLNPSAFLPVMMHGMTSGPKQKL